MTDRIYRVALSRQKRKNPERRKNSDASDTPSAGLSPNPHQPISTVPRVGDSLSRVGTAEILQLVMRISAARSVLLLIEVFLDQVRLAAVCLQRLIRLVHNITADGTGGSLPCAFSSCASCCDSSSHSMRPLMEKHAQPWAWKLKRSKTGPLPYAEPPITGIPHGASIMLCHAPLLNYVQLTYAHQFRNLAGQV